MLFFGDFFTTLNFLKGPEISWRQLMCKLLGLPSDTIFYDNLLEMISERIGCPSRTEALVQLGLLSEEKVERLGTPLDTVSNHLASILSYDSEERDMILMRHEVKGKNWAQFYVVKVRLLVKKYHLRRWLVDLTNFSSFLKINLMKTFHFDPHIVHFLGDENSLVIWWNE